MVFAAFPCFFFNTNKVKDCSIQKNINTMRKYIILLLLLPLAVAAQTNTFGYFRYNKVLEQMPEYAQVCKDYEELKKKCDAEIARNEEQLTRSYVAYLDGQNGQNIHDGLKEVIKNHYADVSS